MTDKTKIKNAKKVYDALCGSLDKKNFHYIKHDEDTAIIYNIQGDDIPMEFVIQIDAERSLIRLLSRIPATFPEERRMDGAIAASQINFRLNTGGFDYDYKTGKVAFRLVSSYLDSTISTELFEFMIAVSSYTVDEYNDKFLMLSKGLISLTEFYPKN